MTVYMPPSLAQFTSMVLSARCEISLDLVKWGIGVEQRLGPKLWENYTGPIPSPLRWQFWSAVAESHDIDVPDLAAAELEYREVLLSVAAKMRLYDASLERLYRIHYSAKLIYDEFLKALDL